jgi:quercetin dioxygenase-like cupin family protein
MRIEKTEHVNIDPFPFQPVDWNQLEATSTSGDAGVVTSRTTAMADVRIRRVDYSPGYIADHWCVKGHVLHVLSGELHTELEDGRTFVLSVGMTYLVGDNAEPHRSSTPAGASLLIID